MNSVQNAINLQCFTGSENFYRHFTGLIYTDGIRFLAEKCGAYWLIDLIASYQPNLKSIPFQLWRIKVNNDSAVVTVQEDSHAPILFKQKIEYTDFPLEECKLYVSGGVLMLPSEY